MRKRLILTALLLALFASPSLAYYRDYDFDLYYILGEVIRQIQRNEESKRDRHDEERRQEEQRQSPYSNSTDQPLHNRETQQQLDERTRSEADTFARLVSSQGAEAALNANRQTWEERGCQVYNLDDRYEKIQRVHDPRLNSDSDYTVIPSRGQVRVHIRNLDTQMVSERYVSYQTYQPYRQTRPIDSLSSVGFSLYRSDRRDRSGHLIIESVTPGTAVYAYGMRRNDSLIRIDSYDTKNCIAERIEGYLQDRAIQGAKVTLTFQHAGKRRTVVVQLLSPVGIVSSTLQPPAKW